MKYLLFSLLLSLPVYAQIDISPGSPLDSSMGEAAGKTGATVNQLTPDEEFESPRQNEEERQEEMLENRYDVPDEKEEEEFNKNG